MEGRDATAGDEDRVVVQDGEPVVQRDHAASEGVAVIMEGADGLVNHSRNSRQRFLGALIVGATAVPVRVRSVCGDGVTILTWVASAGRVSGGDRGTWWGNGLTTLDMDAMPGRQLQKTVSPATRNRDYNSDGGGRRPGTHASSNAGVVTSGTPLAPSRARLLSFSQGGGACRQHLDRQ